MLVKILLYLIFFIGGRDGRDPQNREKNLLLGGDRAGGKGVCGRLMSLAQETQSMQEIRLLRGRLLRKGGGLTGMLYISYKTTFFKKFIVN